MLKDKVLALVKSLHAAAALAPGAAARVRRRVHRRRPSSAHGSLLDALLRTAAKRTQLAVQRNDFKLEQLPPHLFMNFRVVDEHGRQLGIGRNLAALKAELGAQARSAFQALAALKLADAVAAPSRAERRAGARRRATARGDGAAPCAARVDAAPPPRRPRAAARRTPPGPSASCPS